MKRGVITVMKIRSLGYCIKQGFKNIYRNRIFSLASIATMALCIFLFGIFYCAVVNMEYMIGEAEKKTCVTVFFDEGITPERIESIGKSIQQRSEVSLIEFTSSEVAWENFKEQYFGEHKELAEGFANDNPLANHASYTIYLKSAQDQAAIVSFLENIDGIRKVNKSDITANSFMDASGLISMVAVTTVAILFFVALFLISNTVSVGISVRSEEIAIMKLIGAKNGFVRAPFIVEGLVIGFVGAMLPIVVVYYLYENVVSYILNKFVFLSNILTFLPVNEVIMDFVPIAAVLGLGIGFLGSMFTLRKHLKV